MTKKDFALIAEALHTAHPGADDIPAFEQWRMTVRMMAHALKASNPRFDHNRFIAACYGEGK